MLLRLGTLLAVLGLCAGAKQFFYVCPPDFLRLGNNCYFLSKYMEVWTDANIKCKELGAVLAEPKLKHKNRLLKEMLNKPEMIPLERWIGGVYNWRKSQWHWGPSGDNMTFTDFARTDINTEDLQWHCTTMSPLNKYRWVPKSCIMGKHYICEKRLEKMDKRGVRIWQKQNPGKRLNKIHIPNGKPTRPAPTEIDNNVELAANNDANDARNWKNYRPNGDADFAHRPPDAEISGRPTEVPLERPESLRTTRNKPQPQQRRPAENRRRQAPRVPAQELQNLTPEQLKAVRHQRMLERDRLRELNRRRRLRRARLMERRKKKGLLEAGIPMKSDSYKNVGPRAETVTEVHYYK